LVTVLGKFAREATATLLRFSKSTSDPGLAARLVEKAADIQDRTEDLSVPEADPSPGAPEVEPQVAMGSDLEAKADKYESRAAQYYELALQAPEGPQRDFFKVLAVYYDSLAVDFRQASARRGSEWALDIPYLSKTLEIDRSSEAATASILQELAQADRYVAEGRRHIVRQEELIAKLDRNGQDAEEARAILDTLEDTQALHIQHRDRILRELEQ
jgi:hypothetical protein